VCLNENTPLITYFVAIPGPVFRAEATDDDLGMTCPLHGPGESPATCPCATSRFKMLHGADSTLFNVDNETGDVFLAEGTFLQPGREYHFTVEAHGRTFFVSITFSA